MKTRSALPVALLAVVLGVMTAAVWSVRPLDDLPSETGVEILSCQHLLLPEPDLDPTHWRAQASREDAPMWRKQMLQARNYHLCWTHTENQALAAATFPQVMSRRSLLQASSVPPAVASNLQQISTGAIQSIGAQVNSTAASLTDPASATATSQGGTSAWQTKLNAARADSKAKAAAAIDNAYDKAEGTINGLPPGPAQDTAVDIFINGMDKVQDALTNILNQFLNIFNNIADLIRGVFISIYNWAKGAAGTVVDTANQIASVFG